MKGLLIIIAATMIGMVEPAKAQLAEYWIFETLVDESMEVEELAMINGMFSNGSLHFREDGTQTAVLMGAVDIGTWSVSDDMKTLTFVDANGKAEMVEIVNLDDNYLSIRVDDKFTMKYKKANDEEKAANLAEVQGAVTEKEEKISDFNEMSSDFIQVSSSQIAKKWMMDGRDPKPGSSPESAELAKLLMAGSYLHLKPNGKFKLKVIGIKEKGTWKLENDNTQVVTYVDGASNVWNVSSIENNRLVMVKMNDPRSWYFKTK